MNEIDNLYRVEYRGRVDTVPAESVPHAWTVFRDRHDLMRTWPDRRIPAEAEIVLTAPVRNAIAKSFAETLICYGDEGLPCRDTLVDFARPGRLVLKFENGVPAGLQVCIPKEHTYHHIALEDPRADEWLARYEFCHPGTITWESASSWIESPSTAKTSRAFAERTVQRVLDLEGCSQGLRLSTKEVSALLGVLGKAGVVNRKGAA